MTHENLAQLHDLAVARAPIEQAKGMLMLLLGCHDHEAFTVLLEVSRRSHVTLRALVDMVRASVLTDATLQSDLHRSYALLTGHHSPRRVVTINHSQAEPAQGSA